MSEPKTPPAPGETGPPRTCTSCGAAESATLKLKKCTGCRSVQYCGRDCQRQAWSAHKGTCRCLQEEASTRLDEAVQGNDVAAVKSLMAEGVACAGDSSLLWPSLNGRHDLVEALLDNTNGNAAEANVVTDYGSPVFLAAQGGHLDTVRILHVKGNADLNQGNLRCCRRRHGVPRLTPPPPPSPRGGRAGHLECYPIVDSVSERRC